MRCRITWRLIRIHVILHSIIIFRQKVTEFVDFKNEADIVLHMRIFAAAENGLIIIIILIINFVFCYEMIVLLNASREISVMTN
jgi:hypothetical protein